MSPTRWDRMCLLDGWELTGLERRYPDDRAGPAEEEEAILRPDLTRQARVLAVGT